MELIPLKIKHTRQQQLLPYKGQEVPCQLATLHLSTQYYLSRKCPQEGRQQLHSPTPALQTQHGIKHHLSSFHSYPYQITPPGWPHLLKTTWVSFKTPFVSHCTLMWVSFLSLCCSRSKRL